MAQNKKIQILMSTYNGEKYLREQLDSFLNLNCVELIKVLIRDDGSTDNTCNILREYHKKYGFEIIEGKNLGVNKSIMELFNHADLSCEYFAISDQDDVWLPNKFTLALNRLSAYKQDKPALFASLSKIVDENLNPLGSSIKPQKGVSFYNAMIQNITPGHTQVFNRALLEKVIGKDIEFIDVIDGWIYLIASGLGNVTFENEFTVLHRQHGKNTVGYEIRFWRGFYNRVKRLIKNRSNNLSLQLKSFFILYYDELHSQFRDELNKYLLSQSHFINRVKYVSSSRVYRQTAIETFIFKVLYVIGKYKITK